MPTTGLARFLAAAAAAAAAAADAASAALAWRAAAPTGAALEVYADDSYALFAPNGDQWLASAPTAVHSAGAWYSAAASSAAAVAEAAAAAGANCSRLPDVDCRGNDLFYFNSTDPDACCANCSGTAACGAWTWTGVTAASASASSSPAPPSWANRCYIKAACDRQGYAGHVSGELPPAPPLPLSRIGAGPSDDGSGGYEVRYSANGTLLVTAFSLENATGAFVFAQRFPRGASGVAVLTPSNSSAGSVGDAAGDCVGEFASSTTPATQFPVFVPGSASSELGHLSWGGRFFGSFGSGGGGAAAALGAAGGAEGGPLVLFAAGARGAAAVISPLENFKSAILGAAQFAPAGASAAAGVSGYVTALPANFSASTVVLFGAAGVTDTVHAWGAALLARGGGAGAKLADPASEQLTYWSEWPASASAKAHRALTHNACAVALFRARTHTLTIFPRCPPSTQLTTARTTTSTPTSRTSPARACRRTSSRRSPRRSRTARTQGRRCPSGR